MWSNGAFLRRTKMKALIGVVLAAIVSASAAHAGPERTVTEFTIPSSDQTQLKAVLSLPAGRGPFPTVITVHGGKGGRDFDFIRTLATPSEGASKTPTVDMLNETGWAILSIGYRDGAILGAEEDDVIAALRFARNNPALDPRRVALLGGSHGGNLVLRTAIRTGDEASCFAVGAPWMTNPDLYLKGDFSRPPLSEVGGETVRFMTMTRQALLSGLDRRGLVGAELDRVITARSIELNAGRIMSPTLFLISEADVQVPARLVEPTIAAMRAAGRKVEVLKVKESAHGFYWGRPGDGLRVRPAAKTPAQLAEEEMARTAIRNFLTRCLSS
jgi:dipeptidyl aminopeptidase/acylaminoacyl peptidase